MIISNKTFKIFLLILILFIQGCSNISNIFGISYSSGIYIYPEKIKNIKTGLYQTEVFSILGSPTFINKFNKNIWYYVHQKTWYVATFSEKIIEQQILILTFNKDGILTDISSKNVDNYKHLEYDNTTTNFYYKKSYIKPDLFN